MKGAIHIGTSGWSYPHWHGSFYPDDLPSRDALAFYAERLPSVEVNNTFYQFPERGTLETWQDTAPGDFTFSVKASRYLTHLKKLKEIATSLSAFASRNVKRSNRIGYHNCASTRLRRAKSSLIFSPRSSR